MPLNAEDFTWDFLFQSSSAWPMTHILNPFTIQMIFQNPFLTILAVFSWESIEVLALVIFNGQYEIFIGDNSSVEPITDTLIGDIINGILGIILAKLVTFTFKIPSWTPSFFGKYRSIVIKRIIHYLIWVLTLSSSNYSISTGGQYDINIGVIIIFISTSLLIFISYKNNKSNLENKSIWRGLYTNREYELVYIGWFLNASLIIYSAWLHYWNSYFLSWSFAALAILFNLFYLLLSGRMDELIFWANFGFLKYPYYEKQVYF